MLDANLTEQLNAYLAYLRDPIELVVYRDESESSARLWELASLIASLSDKIKVETASDASQRIPSMEIRGNAGAMVFAGVPLGHEFTSLVLALLHSGGHPLKLAAEDIEAIAALKGELVFETYVSLSCQTCPDVVQALNMLAAINPNIRHTMIDGALFQDEVAARGIKAVPTTLLNGDLFTQGRVVVKDILRKLDNKVAQREAETIKQKAPFDLLVVGGGPAGASAAIYAARKGIRVGLVAENFGGQLLDTLSIENFISVPETEGPKLVGHLEAHVADYDVDIMIGHRVETLTPAGSAQQLHSLMLTNGAVISSRAIVLATGASWRELGVPGERPFRGNGVAYCAHCDGPLFKGKRVAVVGGGNSGVEAALDLSGLAESVTVLEFADQLKADGVLQDKAVAKDNITLITGAETLAIEGQRSGVNALLYKDKQTEQQHRLAVDGVFVQIGLVPNTGFLSAVLALNPHGEVITNHQGETSVPGIFAAGDMTESPFKQIVIAMGSGATAALGAFDYLLRSPG